MTRRDGWALALAACAALGCSSSHATDTDAFVARADGAIDATAPIDATDPSDGASIDTGADATADAAPVELDAGVTCDPASCGAQVCGRSDCGAACGECAAGMFCHREGVCRDTPAPGTGCTDAFGEMVAYGASGWRVCDTDPDLLQRCSCSAGDWSACGGCTDVRLAGARGARCATDAQCAGGVPCEPYLHLCGESCSAGAPSPCVPGTACGIPGDVSGACLPTCPTCGASCGDGLTCRAADGEDVCLPTSYGWARSC